MNAREFGQFIKGLGFRAFVAKDTYRGGYGFITDEAGSRVLVFGFSDGGTLSGTYGPSSTNERHGLAYGGDAIRSAHRRRRAQGALRGCAALGAKTRQGLEVLHHVGSVPCDVWLVVGLH